VNPVLRGLRLTWGDRRFRPYVWKPMLAAGLVFAAVVAGGYALIVPPMQAWLDGLAWIPDALLPLVGIVYVVGWVFLAGAVYLAIVGLVSSLLWERLSLEIERAEFGAAPVGGLGCGGSLTDALARLPFNALLALLAVLFGWALFGLAGVMAAGLIGLSDFTASAYARRGVRFPAQFGRARRLRGAVPFLLIAGLVSLVPLLNVFMLPALVAGGTILVAESDAASRGR
jgi:uncharacterized protein involved in cysteine biosynthesis